jgi:hypothetical protein
MYRLTPAKVAHACDEILVKHPGGARPKAMPRE